MLKDAGLEQPARDRLIAALYEYLGLITSYTAGEPEAHAWSLRRGATAHGLTWHFARPPVRDLEYEMDCRAVAGERVVNVGSRLGAQELGR